ncbi:MAG TPA: hypothetical protein VHW67_03645 [Solirubrobacteraceae bacterium]|jgi:sugar lactone lactonase YvrE|nr:hypothetical protein [Solirubrobacteraceae bacterium]
MLALALAAGAGASVGHNFQSAITQAKGAALIEPSAVAVDRSSGMSFVEDSGEGVIDVYDSSGSYVTQFGGGTLLAVGIAVSEATGLVYVADSFNNAILVFKSDGSGGYEQIGEWEGEALPGQGFGEVSGVAVDNSAGPSAGDVYVVDAEDAKLSVGVVDVYKPQPPSPEESQEGELVRVLSKGAMEEPNGVAVDSSSGRVYVADSAKGAVYEFSATGASEEKLNGSSSPQGAFGKEEAEGNVTAVAVDPLSGDLLVAEAERADVSEFNSTGQWVGWIPPTAEAPLGEPHGLALDGSGRLYVTDALLGQVDRYGPGAVVPDVSTEKASKPARTSTILNGTLNGLGKTGHYFFQWGTTASLGQSTTPVALPASQQGVSATLEGLTAGATYFFRLVAENEDGMSYGLIREVSTAPAVEKLSTGPVSNLQPESATLSGSLAPNGFDTHYYFQWGTSTGYGNSSPEAPGTDAGSEKGSIAATAQLSGLTPNTTYHYRVVASNSFGSTFGADQKFTTSGPPRITAKPVGAIGHDTATLNAEVNPDEIETTYRFEYGESIEYGQQAPAGGADIGKGGTPVAVSAPLTGLKLGVTYHYRVVAENAFKTTTGPDQTFTTIPPALTSSWASGISATEATLNAEINPLGNDTTYYFQYGPEPCAPNPAACTSSPVPPGEDIGSGEAAITKTLKLTGLEADSTYHFRVIAINSLGEGASTEHTLSTQEPAQTFALADNRAWELVSPPDKEGAPVEALTREGGIILASEDGGKLTYVVDSSLGEDVEGNRSPEMQQVLAERGSSSWSSKDIATPNTKVKGTTAGEAPEYQSFTADLSSALVEPAELGPLASPPLAAGVVQATPYIRDNATGTYVPLITEANTAAGTAFGNHVHFAGASADLGSAVLASEVALNGPGSTPGLYEWSAGALNQVSMLPSGLPAPGLAELGFLGRTVAGAVSANGSRVVWTKREESTGRGHLYLRDLTRGETVQIDAAHGVPEPAGLGSARYQAAGSDGSRILFTDKQQLTADSTAEAGQGLGSPDLYMCQVIEEAGKLTCKLTDLTIDHIEGEHAAVQGFVLGSDAEVGVAFVIAQGVLASNPNGIGDRAVSGAPNLYELRFAPSEPRMKFIATLSSQDSPEWEAGGAQSANPAFVTARVSENGRYFAFMSQAPVTGYDNVDISPAAHGARDEEVFLYDSAGAELRCVSCDPTGQRPDGVLDNGNSGEGLGLVVDRRKVWGELSHEHWLAGNIPGWTSQSLTSAVLQPRYLTDDGRLFFNSPEQIVPADSNGKNDAYEYEPSGVGSCESVTGGCVSLISSGTSPRESAFLEATPDAGSVFFLTESKLLPQDTDTAYDIYDARTCSPTSPCQTIPAPAPAPCAESETCRAASPGREIPGAGGGSATFAGPGNAVAALPSGTGVKGDQTTAKPKPLTRKQRLAKALAQCRHKHGAHKRKACERHARKLYGPHAAKKGASRGRNLKKEHR